MEILFRDDRLLAAVKPAGVLSTDESGGMPDLIRAALEEKELPIRSVHRLDRVVGGVMVYALTRRAAADMSRQIREGSFHKEYLAVVHGRPSEDCGVVRDCLHRDRVRHRTEIVPEGSPEAWEAELSYKLLSASEDLSLLLVALQTGRTHQIRCQLAGRGLPIVGDRKYGAPEQNGPVALWSHKIECVHPRTGERLVFEKRPPESEPWLRFQASFAQKNTSA